MNNYKSKLQEYFNKGNVEDAKKFLIKLLRNSSDKKIRYFISSGQVVFL